MADNSIDFSKLPVPKEIGKEHENLHFLSEMFMKMTDKEVLQISSNATTPMWLKPSLYTKLEVDDEDDRANMLDNFLAK